VCDVRTLQDFAFVEPLRERSKLQVMSNRSCRRSRLDVAVARPILGFITGSRRLRRLAVAGRSPIMESPFPQKSLPGRQFTGKNLPRPATARTGRIFTG